MGKFIDTGGLTYLWGKIKEADAAVENKAAEAKSYAQGVGNSLTALSNTVSGLLNAQNAMVFKGTLGSGGTVSALPTSNFSAGWTYKVANSGTWAGQTAHAGDLVICIKDNETNTAVDATSTYWAVCHTNESGNVLRSGNEFADGKVMLGASGNSVKVSSYTIGASVPSNAVFTDATTSARGYMTSAMVTKLNGIATGANNYSLPPATTTTRGGVTIGSNISTNNGQINITNGNICDALGFTPANSSHTHSLPTGGNGTLGVVKTTSAVTSNSGYTAAPIIDGVVYYKDTNTTYAAATTGASGLMTAAMVTKLNGIATGATADSALSNTEIDAAIAAAT